MNHNLWGLNSRRSGCVVATRKLVNRTRRVTLGTLVLSFVLMSHGTSARCGDVTYAYDQLGRARLARQFRVG